MTLRIEGKRFGRLTALSRLPKNRALFRCDCGREKAIVVDSVTRGRTKSCGCMQRGPKREDMTGKRFGRVVVVEPVGPLGSFWICRCDCGKWTKTSTAYLKTGMRSCGCIRSGGGLNGRPRKYNLAQRRFGRLTCLSPEPYLGWKCRCDCGAIRYADPYDLRRGIARMCCACRFPDSESECTNPSAIGDSTSQTSFAGGTAISC